MKQFLYKYKHGWVFSYMFLYLAWFFYLEQRKWVPMTVIHTPLDDIIPFNELFLIPYLLWFLYVPVIMFYCFFTSKEEFYKVSTFLFVGMTICLIIYTLWPNCQNLRPKNILQDNVLVTLVKHLYGFDTSTNVCPSIHVFNSIGVHIALTRSKTLKDKKLLKTSSFILAVLISLSTVFLKQHSVIDGLCSILLACFMYLLVYVINYSKLKKNLAFQIPR